MTISWRKDVKEARVRLDRNTGFLQLAPWLNALIIVVLFFAVADRITITPGINFQLPKAPLAEGVLSKMPKAVLIIPPESSESFLFFEDARYSLSDDNEVGNLISAMRQSQQRDGWESVILYADESIPNGDVIRFINVARDAVPASVCIATQSVSK